MRKILMSKPGEFQLETRVDFVRGLAMKKLANMLQPSQSPQEINERVSVSDDPKKYWKLALSINRDKKAK